MRILAQKEHMYLPEDVDCARLVLEWISKQQGIVCDLDLTLYLYDERVSRIAVNLSTTRFMYSGERLNNHLATHLTTGSAG